MSQTCKRCYRVVDRACRSDTETADCKYLAPRGIVPNYELASFTLISNVHEMLRLLKDAAIPAEYMRGAMGRFTIFVDRADMKPANAILYGRWPHKTPKS